MHLEEKDEVNKAVIGDSVMSSWNIVKRFRPDVVAVGYDQKNLKESLEDSMSDFSWPLEIETISAHDPEEYRSSIINGN